MKQEGESIYNFKKGDIITRVEPMGSSDGPADYTFVGKKFIFKGIANASIYLSKELDIISTLFLGRDSMTIQLPLGIAEEGWAHYIDPDFLDDDSEVISESEKSIQSKIERAIDEDDYETAEKLRKKLEELKNKK